MTNTSIKPCLLIVNFKNIQILQEYLQEAIELCAEIFVLNDKNNNLASLKNSSITRIDINERANYAKALYKCLPLAKAKGCSHIISVDINTTDNIDDIKNFMHAINKNNLAIFIGTRNFNNQKVPPTVKIEKLLSSFWLRVQTSQKLADIHHCTKAYPIAALDFLRIKEMNYAFDAELLVRAAWAGFFIAEIPIQTKSIPKASPSFSEHLRMIALNTKFTMRALVPLPFRRFKHERQERVSLRHPLKALRQLMHDPYNRATPWQLARTAGISMAILTVPAPIIQSIFLLLSIGWLKLNRLCAIAMIPLTWPPFLPALAILVGYRVRNGHWLTEFNVQTLGYEVGERLLEWVIGSLCLTPILGLLLGAIVGFAALLVDKKS